MINAKLQNIIDTKSAIGNAINNKGGSITVNTPFYNYAAEIDNLSTGGGGAGAYSTWVVQDENLAKYTAYNGYDQVTNPTPDLTNLPFGYFLLNNSATGTVVLNNTIMLQSSNAPFQNNNAGINIAYMPFAGKGFYDGTIYNIAINNGNIFVAGTNGGNAVASVVRKYNEANLVEVANSPIYNSTIHSLKINNGYVYAVGSGSNTIGRNIVKYHESNLIFVNNSASYGNTIRAMAINNGYIYVGGDVLTGINRGVSKFYEDNLALVGNTVNYGGTILTIGINNGFLYVGGTTNQTVQKFYEDNLTFVGNSASTGSVNSIVFNNGYVFYGNSGGRIIRVFESNLARPATNNQSELYGATILTLSINNGYIYAGGQPNIITNRGISKFYEDNLALVANTPIYDQTIWATAINNGYFYLGGQKTIGSSTNVNFDKHLEQADNLVDIPIYSINRVKE